MSFNGFITRPSNRLGNGDANALPETLHSNCPSSIKYVKYTGCQFEVCNDFSSILSRDSLRGSYYLYEHSVDLCIQI